jgi:hypothetical protein
MFHGQHSPHLLPSQFRIHQWQLFVYRLLGQFQAFYPSDKSTQLVLFVFTHLKVDSRCLQILNLQHNKVHELFLDEVQ